MPEQDILASLDARPEFQKLSAEAKELVRSKVTTKFAGLSDQAKQLVYQKLGTAPAAPKEPGMLGKAWNALEVPAQKAEQAITGLTDVQNTIQNKAADATGLPIGTEPTGNLTRDVIANTPRIMGETAAEVLPGAIDRTAILTAGVGGLGAKVAGKVAGKLLTGAKIPLTSTKIPGIAPWLEKGSGLQPGTLVEAFKDPKMIVDFGRKLRAQELYNEAKQGATLPKTLLEARNIRIADKAIKAMADGKVMTSPDAFNARKAIRALIRANQKSKAYNDDFLLQAEEGLTAMVFSGVNKADKLYQGAIRGEQMRSYGRLTQKGQQGAVTTVATHLLPNWLKPVYSPLLQGAGASAAGAAAQIPVRGALKAGAMVGAGLDRLKSKKKEKHRGK